MNSLIIMISNKNNGSSQLSGSTQAKLAMIALFAVVSQPGDVIGASLNAIQAEKQQSTVSVAKEHKVSDPFLAQEHESYPVEKNNFELKSEFIFGENGAIKKGVDKLS